jgi:proton-translocating NAD(P)+ transhydrogenase subunit alpha
MRIAVPAETRAHEARVAATPETVKKLIAGGCTVTVQQGAGARARFADAAYQEAGARIEADYAATCKAADVVLKVQAPDAPELAQTPQGAALIAMFSPHTNPLLADYAKAGLSCFAMELVPRISRAQGMDVLSSQANIAGYKAVLVATEHYQRFFPMLMTAAGTVTPARVLVLGAGVAGLQAIATARRLGAMVEAFDVRTAAKEQVLSLGAKFVEVPVEENAEDAGGYAREVSEEYKKKQGELVAQHAAQADIIITTALIPGRPAPELISKEMVESMKPGSVIVDLAVEAGGNCPLSKLNEVVEHQGVTIVGHGNLPSLLATDASNLYARNLYNFLVPMINGGKGELKPDPKDEIVAASLITHRGEFRKPELLKGGKK